MSEVKHTPGPWSIEYGLTNDPEKYTPGIDAKSGFSILMFGTKSQHEECGIRGRTIDEQEANARLIAAAPELLEALRIAMPTLQRLKFEADGSYGSNFNRHRAETARRNYEAARAAIAKATGGQP